MKTDIDMTMHRKLMRLIPELADRSRSHAKLVAEGYMDLNVDMSSTDRAPY
jgi:hypothetical protein